MSYREWLFVVAFLLPLLVGIQPARAQVGAVAAGTWGLSGLEQLTLPDILGTARTYGALAARGATAAADAAGAAVTYASTQAVNYANGAIQLSARMVAPAARIAGAAADICFANPVLCVTGVAAAYLAGKYFYGPSSTCSGGDSCWQVLGTGIGYWIYQGSASSYANSTYHALSADDACIAIVTAYFGGAFVSANSPVQYTETGVNPNNGQHYGSCGYRGNPNAFAEYGDVLQGVSTPASPPQMSGDMQAQAATQQQAGNGYDDLLAWVDANGGSIAVDDTDNATITPVTPAVTDTVANPDGSQTQYSDVVNCGGNTVASASCTITRTSGNTAANDANAAGTTAGMSNPSDTQQQDVSFTDTPLPDVPHLYDQKYPDGLAGVWAQRSPALMNSAFMTSVTGMFSGFSNSGTCPSWSMNLDFGPHMDFGNADLSPPCWIWSVVSLILITTAVFAARQIVWG